MAVKEENAENKGVRLHCSSFQTTDPVSFEETIVSNGKEQTPISCKLEHFQIELSG